MSITNALPETAAEWPETPQFHPFDDGPGDAPGFTPDAILAAINANCPGWMARRTGTHFWAMLRGRRLSLSVWADTATGLATRIAEVEAGDLR